MENIQTTATRSLANSTVRIKPRRAGVPCVRCRQMKVKCNASQRFPAACSACEKAGERCSVDPLFKRVSKRSVKQVSREGSPAYRTPQSEVSISEPTSVPPRSDGPCLDSLATVTAELRGGKRHARFTHGTTGINLWSGAVAELLEEYYSNMHPRFPLLLDPDTVVDSYEKAPLLFWTVVAIASKDSDKYASDYARLQILVRQLVADIILLGTRSIYLVQALLLLCAWSFPHTDMSKEPFSMYCSMAISMARSLGLHRPQHPYILFAAKAAEIGTLETRTSTWLSCFIIDQWHTARFGVPSSIRIDHTVLHAVNGSMTWLPATTRIQLHIALITSKISTALGECETSSTGLAPDPLPFIRLFESELCMIQDKYSSEWSPADEVSFLDARLSLYCYALGKKTEHLNTLDREKEHGLITQGTITCTQLLTIVTTFPDTLRKGTIHVFRSAGYAVFFLLRILGTAPSELIDGTTIRNIIRQTFTLMRQISQTSNDRRSQCMRVCRIIEHMLDSEDWNENAETPFLGKAESFMGMNFVADVAARGILKAYKYTRQAVAARMERERDGNRDSRQAGPPEVQSDAGSQFDLDFSIWDPMEWPTNWLDGDDFLFPSSSIGAS